MGLDLCPWDKQTHNYSSQGTQGSHVCPVWEQEGLLAAQIADSEQTLGLNPGQFVRAYG